MRLRSPRTVLRRVRVAGLTLRQIEGRSGVATRRVVAVRRNRPDTRRAARRRHSTRRARASPPARRHLVVRENENVDQLDLLATSCVTLTRVAMSLPADDRRVLQSAVGDLAEVLATLAASLGDRAVRQGAADRAFDTATRSWDIEPEAGSTAALATSLVRLVALDIMVFAGIDAGDATAAIRDRVLEERVPAPPRSRGLIGTLRAWFRGS